MWSRGAPAGRDENEIWFIIHAFETMQVNVDGSSQQTRYQSLVAFKFPKNYLPTAQLEDIRPAISEILLTEDQSNASSTKTVELGQSPEVVKDILGPPGSVINLGSKSIYVYDDLKIIFVDGKVTDVN